MSEIADTRVPGTSNEALADRLEIDAELIENIVGEGLVPAVLIELAKRQREAAAALREAAAALRTPAPDTTDAVYLLERMADGWDATSPEHARIRRAIAALGTPAHYPEAVMQIPAIPTAAQVITDTMAKVAGTEYAGNLGALAGALSKAYDDLREDVGTPAAPSPTWPRVNVYRDGELVAGNLPIGLDGVRASVGYAVLPTPNSCDECLPWGTCPKCGTPEAAAPEPDAAALLDALVEWNKKYPPGRVYPHYMAAEVTGELNAICEAAARLRTTHSTQGDDR